MNVRRDFALLDVGWAVGIKTKLFAENKRELV